MHFQTIEKHLSFYKNYKDVFLCLAKLVNNLKS